MRAIILIKIGTGQIKSAIKDLKKIRALSDVHLTFGPYDAIVMFEAEDLNQIGRMVERQIRPIPGVVKTLTCLIVEGDLMNVPQADENPAAKEQPENILTVPVRSAFGRN